MNGASHRFKADGVSTYFDWNDDTLAKLRDLHKAGFACSYIAGVLGTTRNAVIGKIHRMGLNGKVYTPSPRAERPKAAASPPKRRPPAQPKPIPRPRIVPRQPEPPMLEVLPLPNAWEPIAGTEPVALVDLDRGMCKWPVSDRPFLFCGCKAEEGASYCPSHQRRSLGTGTPSERKALSIAVNEVKKERVSA